MTYYDEAERIKVERAQRVRADQDKIWEGLTNTERDEVLKLHEKLRQKRIKEFNNY